MASTEVSEVTEVVTGEVTKVRKGKNFTVEEDKQLCRSFLSISQDPIVGNGQKSSSFWERVAKSYNLHMPLGCCDRNARSLECKWGTIRHDVSKFCGVHSQVLGMHLSGVSSDDVLERALLLYKEKSPKQIPFTYIDCWLILKDVPRWAETVMEARQRTRLSSPASMAKRKSLTPATVELGDGDSVLEDDPADVDDVEPARKWQARPIGVKAAKEDQKITKQRECSARAQARATADMAEASFKKAKTMEDAAGLALFTMPEPVGMSEQARAYLAMRREEEMERIEQRRAEKKIVATREAKESARQVRVNAAEVEWALRNRVPPPPLSPNSSQPATTSPEASVAGATV